MKLIEGWRQFHKFWSVRLAALAAALPPLWSAIPDDIKNRLPGPTATIGASVIAVAIIVARIIPQQAGSNTDAQQ